MPASYCRSEVLKESGLGGAIVVGGTEVGDMLASDSIAAESCFGQGIGGDRNDVGSGRSLKEHPVPSA